MTVGEAIQELRKVSWAMRGTGNAIQAEAIDEDLTAIENFISELQAQVIRLTLGTHELHMTPVRGCLECFDDLRTRVDFLQRTLVHDHALGEDKCPVCVYEVTLGFVESPIQSMTVNCHTADHEALAHLRRTNRGLVTGELVRGLDEFVKLEAHLKVHHRIEFGTDDCQLAQYAKGA